MQETEGTYRQAPEAGKQYLTPGQRAWRRLLRNKAAVLGMCVIALAAATAVFAYLVAPDGTPNANDQIAEISKKPPGFAVKVLKVRKNMKVEAAGLPERLLEGQRNPYTLVPIYDYKVDGNRVVAHHYTGIEPVGNCAIDLKVLTQTQLLAEGLLDKCDLKLDTFLLADLFYAVPSKSLAGLEGQEGEVSFTDVYGKPQKVRVQELAGRVAAENVLVKRYVLGTDDFGRDNLSRLILGVRISLSVGIIAVMVSLLIGITLGAVAGFYGGRVDDAIMWLINVFWSIPLLLLVFAMVMVLGREFWQIYLAVGLTMWVEVARIVRGQVLSVREEQYVEAARGLGFGNMRIIARHILPNIVGPVVVISAANFASAIIIEAGLSFLGIGVKPPTPSWGGMLKEYYSYMGTSKAYLALVPGVAILVLVLAFNLLGNGLRDALDVKSRG